MKFIITLSIILYISDLILNAKDTNTTGNNSIKSTSHATNSTSAPATNSTPPSVNKPDTADGQNKTESNSSVAGQGTNVFAGKNNASDALGIIRLSNYSVSAPPYTINDCNQILLIDVQRMKTMEDYAQREPAFFTMSIYMANIFQTKDSNKLLDSLTLDKMKKAPQLISGAPGCLTLNSDKRNITICTNGPEVADQLIIAYTNFKRCRAGKNPLTECDIKNMDKHKLHGKNNKSNLHNNTSTDNNNTANVTNSIYFIDNNGMKINKYYADLRVPGSTS